MMENHLQVPWAALVSCGYQAAPEYAFALGAWLGTPGYNTAILLTFMRDAEPQPPR